MAQPNPVKFNRQDDINKRYAELTEVLSREINLDNTRQLKNICKDLYVWFDGEDAAFRKQKGCVITQQQLDTLIKHIEIVGHQYKLEEVSNGDYPNHKFNICLPNFTIYNEDTGDQIDYSGYKMQVFFPYNDYDETMYILVDTNGTLHPHCMGDAEYPDSICFGHDQVFYGSRAKNFDLISMVDMSVSVLTHYNPENPAHRFSRCMENLIYYCEGCDEYVSRLYEDDYCEECTGSRDEEDVFEEDVDGNIMATILETPSEPGIITLPPEESGMLPVFSVPVYSQEEINISFADFANSRGRLRSPYAMHTVPGPIPAPSPDNTVFGAVQTRAEEIAAAVRAIQQQELMARVGEFGFVENSSNNSNDILDDGRPF